MPKQKEKNEFSNHQAEHKPVLLKEVISCLQPEAGQSFLDVTAGYGGHAEAVLDRTLNPKGTTLVDRDEQAITSLQKRFAGNETQVIHRDFLQASKELIAEGKKFDMILADLGVSSPHLNEAKRGFAFALSGPLDMRMDRRQELTAGQIVNGWSEADLIDVLRHYGQEPKAAQIARRIMQARPIKTTDQLAHIVAKAWPGKRRIHPATRTFQALRIAVNSELAQLEQSLPVWLELLNSKGRLAVISFHSLEDRIVKRFFAEHSGEAYDAELTVLTKKPVRASTNEIVSNPRARSARLRACSKK